MLSISFASRIITPQEPSYLCGHAMRTEISEGIHDDLLCKALVLKIDGKMLLWISYDLIMLDREMSDRIRKNLSEKHNIAFELITCSFIHTHSGPEISVRGTFDNDEAKGARPGYREFLEKTAYELADECMSQDFTEVEVYGSTFEIDGFYSNRNGKDKLGDKSVNMIMLKDADDNNVLSLINMSCHPTVLGPQNLKISGDLFGYIARGVKEKFGIDAFMMNGAAGNMSNRCYRQGNDYAELIRVGDGILSQIVEKYPGSETRLSIDKVELEKYHFHDEYDNDKDMYVAEIEKAENDLKSETDFDKIKLLKSGLAFLKHNMKLDHIVNDFDVQILKLGDVEICQFPGELFASFGLKIKAGSDAKMPIVWGYVNYLSGYVVESDEYGKTYESMTTPFRQGDGERISADLAELM